MWASTCAKPDTCKCLAWNTWKQRFRLRYPKGDKWAQNSQGVYRVYQECDILGKSDCSRWKKKTGKQYKIRYYGWRNDDKGTWRKVRVCKKLSAMGCDKKDKAIRQFRKQIRSGWRHLNDKYQYRLVRECAELSETWCNKWKPTIKQVCTVCA